MTFRITACMRCGSSDLRMPSVGAGDAFLPYAEDLMGTAVCKRCDYKSVPISFDRIADFEAFSAQREREGWTQWEAKGGGMRAVPTVDASPSSPAFPALLFIGGLFLVFLGIAAIATSLSNASGVGWFVAIPLFLLGFGSAAVGARQKSRSRK